MQAQKQPNDDPQRDGTGILTPFLTQYGEALDVVKKAAEQTATAQWQETYAAFVRRTRESREAIAKDLRQMADLLDVNHLGEEREKELTQVKKTAEYLREREATWLSTTITPLKEPVDRANALVDVVMRQARLDEERNPLIAKGLAKRVMERIDTLPRATWDDTTGTIEVKLPRGQREKSSTN